MRIRCLGSSGGNKKCGKDLLVKFFCSSCSSFQNGEDHVARNADGLCLLKQPLADGRQRNISRNHCLTIKGNWILLQPYVPRRMFLECHLYLNVAPLDGCQIRTGLEMWFGDLKFVSHSFSSPKICFYYILNINWQLVQHFLTYAEAPGSREILWNGL